MDAATEVDGGARLEDARVDGSDDAGSLPQRPSPYWPTNGAFTGSPWANAPAPAHQPLQPRFVWSPVDGATSYRLQLDDGCPLPFGDCAFDDPEVDVEVDEAELTLLTPLPVQMTAPVGRRYFWRVRACGETDCSAWSEIRYLNVGRMASDYNGDGYADVLVGAPFTFVSTGMEGAVYVYSGSESGLSGEPSQTVESPATRFVSGRFGASVSAGGDLDADGFADAIVGYSGASAYPNLRDGEVRDPGPPDLVDNARILFGSIDGLVLSPLPLFVGEEDIDLVTRTVTVLGTTVTVSIYHTIVGRGGDVDADGYDDMLVAVLADGVRSTYPGHVYGYLGGPNGGSRVPSYRFDNPESANTSLGINALFGQVLGSGDLDADGFSDVIVSAPEQDGFHGAAYVFPGRAAARGTWSNEVSLNDPIWLPAMTSNFGSAIAGRCDADSDGLADLIIGARQHATGRYGGGAIFVYPGTRDGLTEPPYERVPVESGGFGSAADCGDVNGDGQLDVVGGARGAVFVMPASFTPDAVPESTRLIDPEAEADIYFGNTVFVDDVDGDGYADIVAASNGTSRLIVFHGDREGVAESRRSVRQVPCSRDLCGVTLATAPR